MSRKAFSAPVAIHTSNGSQEQYHNDSTTGNTVDFCNLITANSEFTVIPPPKRNSLSVGLLTARSVHNTEMTVTGCGDVINIDIRLTITT